MRSEVSRHYGINICIHCDHKMSHGDEYYSGGVCPHCGGMTRGVHCNIHTIVVQRTDYYTDGSFWKRSRFIRSEYIGKDVSATNWIKKALKNKWI